MRTPASRPPDRPAGGFPAGGGPHTAYNLALCAALLLAAPAWIPWVLLSRKRRANFRERLGLGIDGIPPPSGRERVWIHGVSVGETLSAVPLVRVLRRRLPGIEILFSTVTLTGREVAEKSLGPATDARFYFPFDLPGTCAKFLDRVRPDVVAILETEIWPNFIAACAARGIPVVVLNGRISDRSFRGYARFGLLFSKVFSSVAAFSVQTEEDAARIAALGVRRSAIEVAGNMKFDVAPPPEELTPFHGWMLEEKGRGTRWFVAGSTHEGEDAPVLNAFRSARAIDGSLRLLLAPRHPERFDAVAAMCESGGWSVARKTRLRDGGGARAAEVVLLDTLGELLSAYAAADIAFVGGSLVPKGGHNILEPALYGVPVVVGPHMGNFREIADIFIGGGAVMQVESDSGLVDALSRWAEDPSRHAAMGRRASELLAAFRGAAERNAAIVMRELAGRRKGPDGRP